MKYRKDRTKNMICLLVISSVLLFFSSCISSKNLKYVYQGDDFNIKNSYFNERPNRTIRSYDNLYLKILSIEGKSVVSLLETEKDQKLGSDLNLIYYQVTDSGNIDIPFIGEIKISNMTLSEAKKEIESELAGYFVNPSVIIKFVNIRVTVLGEVNHPGTYPYFKEPISIFQAIGLAGGIKEFGNKKEVLLIREENNLITYNTIDLTDKKMLESYFYYIKPEDVIIIYPTKAKYFGKGAINYSTILSSITTLLAILYFYQSQPTTQ